MRRIIGNFLLVFFAAATIGMLVSFSKPAKSAQTAGTVTFTFKTVTDNGTYSPKHVMAVWVEDSNGFVKSRLVQAQQRKQYLYTWIAASGQNSVDAVTGATLSSHQQRTINWDCTDLSGNVVPDGDYTIRVEYTDKHAQGPLTAVTFTKAGSSVHLTPANQTYFTNMDLQYTPAAPTADFSVDQTTVCNNQSVIFTDASSGATSWEWNFGADAVPATASTAGPHTVTYSTSGQKTITLTVNGTTVSTQTNLVTVQEAAVASFTYAVSQNLNVQFTNISTNSTSWSWDFGDGSTSTDENPMHSYAAAGSYTIQLTSSNGSCDNAVSQSIELSTQGISENENSGICLFPNPAKDQVTITAGSPISPKAKLQIFNAQGREETSFVSEKTGNSSIQLSINNLPAGSYWIQLTDESKTFSKKLVIF